jgi:hypothetical protein
MAIPGYAREFIARYYQEKIQKYGRRKSGTCKPPTYTGMGFNPPTG